MTSINFCFDIWTGSNRHSYLGITGHWIDVEGDEKNALLGFERIQGEDSHSGENQAAVFWKVIKKYGIEHLIGCFTLDNASNNDTALKAIARYLRRLNITFVLEERRIRCFGHILNLVVKDFLWGSDPELLKLGLEERGDDADEIAVQQFEKDFDSWKKVGPLKKLHNALVFIRASTQRLDQFANIVRTTYPEESNVSVIPVIGNLTRWSSDYASLKWSLKKREALTEYLQEAADSKDYKQFSNEDMLSTDDWKDLVDIMAILEPLKRNTERFQFAYASGSIADIIPVMDEPFEFFEAVREVHKHNDR
ncbi:MAG: hypothetical protein ACE3JU_17360 [Paenibacillus sp.]|uniref:hypothetical protein n=1 Tax=Paenibacillus sp. TaxID=58172 RepID=UPI003B802A4D